MTIQTGSKTMRPPRASSFQGFQRKIGMALAGNFALLRAMRPWKHRSFWFLTPLFLAAAISWGGAEVRPNPYQAIIERNPFGLKPPPPPPDPTPPGPVIPPPKVVLTGIVSAFGP